MKPVTTLAVLLASCTLAQHACDAQSLGYVGDIVVGRDGPYIRVNQITPGSPAEKMLLRAGDYIGRINGFPPQNQEVIRRATLSRNGSVVLDVIRSNQYIQLRGSIRGNSSDEIILGKPQLNGAITGDNFLEAAAKVNRGENLAILPKLGIRVRSYTRNTITRLFIDGIDVTGLAYQHGLRRGDTILRANGLTLINADDLSRAALRVNHKINLTVQTPGRSPRGVTITDKPQTDKQAQTNSAPQQPTPPQLSPSNQSRFARPSIKTPQSSKTPQSRFARPSMKTPQSSNTPRSRFARPSIK